MEKSIRLGISEGATRRTFPSYIRDNIPTHIMEANLGDSGMEDGIPFLISIC